MIKDVMGLLDALHVPLLRPEYQPTEDATHCNQYVDEVCGTYGFHELDGLLANEILDKISTHPQWSKVPLEKAQELANQGSLIIAGTKGSPHGHVCVICPGKEKTSGRWGKVPSVANVGKTVFIGQGINWAFSDYPTLWAWRPSL